MGMSAFKYTSDNWYPSFELKDGKSLVEVGFSCITMNNGDECVVYACGDDDLGFSREFTSKDDALQVFHYILGMEDVTWQALQLLSFTSWS